MPELLKTTSGIPAVDRYLKNGFVAVPGMSSRFAAGIVCGLMRIQTSQGVSGHAVEIGTFQGRFFIALAHALQAGELAIGIDTFDWPTPAVLDRFEENCNRYGIGPGKRITWKARSTDIRPEALSDRLEGGRARLFHLDGDHTRPSLAHDLELATSVLCPGGLIVLDDMLHPGYPMLMVAVHEYLQRHPEMTVLCVIDRESLTAASKFVLCEAAWFKRYEAVLLEDYKAHIWPMGSRFEPHWCLVFSLDTALPAVD